MMNIQCNENFNFNTLSKNVCEFPVNFFFFVISRKPMRNNPKK